MNYSQNCLIFWANLVLKTTCMNVLPSTMVPQFQGKTGFTCYNLNLLQLCSQGKMGSGQWSCLFVVKYSLKILFIKIILMKFSIKILNIQYILNIVSKSKRWKKVWIHARSFSLYTTGALMDAFGEFWVPLGLPSFTNRLILASLGYPIGVTLKLQSDAWSTLKVQKQPLGYRKTLWNPCSIKKAWWASKWQPNNPWGNLKVPK